MNIDFLTQCGRVKKTSVEMMRDRGYDVKNELWILDSNLTDLAISLVYLKKSAKNNVSLCSSLGNVYFAALNTNTNNSPSSIAVHFLDRNFDESRQRDKMVSTEQFKAVLREYSKQKANKCVMRQFLVAQLPWCKEKLL